MSSAESDSALEAQLALDPAGLKRYREANLLVPPPTPDENRVVFMGDSITDAWGPQFQQYFPGKPYMGRGISGQTTQQMLARFRADVIALRPQVVVILAGTNDIAANGGLATQEMIADNIMSMVELARYHGIKPVLVSVLPAAKYSWRPGIEPADKIVKLNTWLKGYAARESLVYVDCHAPLADEHQGMKKDYADDGVHPNAAGYGVMAPLVEAGIEKALASGKRRKR